MKFSCEKALLQAVIPTISKAVSPKSSIPVLEGVLLEVDSDLRLIGYNLETGIHTTIPVDIRKEGTLVLGVRLFDEIVRKLPDDITTFQSENYTVNTKCGMSEFSVLDIDPEEFPELPTVEYQNSLILPQSRLEAMISQILSAVSDNEGRPIHTGSLFKVDSEGLTIVSVDGYRLTFRHEFIDKKEGAETLSLVVPGTVLSEAEEICSDVDESAPVTQDVRYVMFRVGNAMLVSRRLEGEFLAHRQVIPRNNTVHVEGDIHVLPSSTDRVSPITSDKPRSPLCCVFDSNLLKISAKTTIGDAYNEHPFGDDGDGLKTGFNNKYLIDTLKAAPTDKVWLELTTGVSPCVILPIEGEENFLYMVLPVRLKADE